MVTIGNYEEYMMLDADGELDSMGKAALAAFLVANPVLQQELAIWHSSKLQPDITLGYPDKQSLHREKKGLLVSYSPYLLAAAAALAGLLILIPALYKNDHHREYTAATKHRASQSVIITDTTKHATALNPDVKDITSFRPEKLSKPSYRLKIGIAAIKHRDSFVALNISDGGLLNQRPLVITPQMQRAEMPVEISPNIPGYQESGFPRISIAEESKPAIHLFRRAFNERVEQLTAAARSIKETAVVIRLGNGSINLNL